MQVLYLKLFKVKKTKLQKIHISVRYVLLNNNPDSVSTSHRKLEKAIMQDKTGKSSAPVPFSQ